MSIKIRIENLTSLVRGFNLTLRQKADAFLEFNKLLNYVEELEQKEQEKALQYKSSYTDKTNEAVHFVILYTRTNGKPPTYEIIANHFSIKRTAAYYRLRYHRHLMKTVKQTAPEKQAFKEKE